ncbi:ABC-type cobalamin/Fe3+-siderophores transport system, ATPase component [Gulbenkiania indica]|uniref:ABC-type cobalamin/Fe3+-siderophores transport system, ATPase component n=2 Tax=Gulbenkiania TaxID=397456 RepID=A0A0K6GUY8_9NEIS|nr:ATP-binding cassette domain-containing protein [Gulbenkiania indica]TCW33968.1 iron complex transport system ATP-binding protein [Gulbenkiania mobilis]CUA82337.1 ABC-type cobalamin/Fe3+-siderophores transport system, ATPase component [Gulbenkiania indica]
MLEAARAGLSRQGRILLHPVDLIIHPGRLLVLLGANGAGKSTLLGLLSGRLRPSHGAVRLSGADVTTAPIRWLAQRRACLEQQPALAEGFTVRELVEMGGYWRDSGAPAPVVERALSDGGVAALAGRPAEMLSGGEYQRTLLARALAQLYASDAPERFLLLDEPTSAQDIGFAEQQLALVAGLCRREGFGAVAAVHDLNLALRHADDVALLSGGRLVAFGTVADVMQGPLLEAAFGVSLIELNDPSTGLRAFLPHPG